MDGSTRRLRWSCVAVTVVAVAALAGKLLDVPLLASVIPSSIPMAPSTACAFILLAAALHPDLPWSRSRHARLGLLLPAFFLPTMSPLTAGLFCVVGAAAAAHLPRGPEKSIPAAAWGTALAATFSSVVLIGYLYGAPMFYGGRIIPMAATTAACFLVLSGALLAEVGRGLWPWSLFEGDSPRALMMRTFLPLSAAIILAKSLLEVGFEFRGSPLIDAVIMIGTLLCAAWLVASLSERVDASIESAEKRLGASEARTQAILRTAIDGFWMADLAGRLLEVNDAYCRMSGYSREELLAMRIPQLEVGETHLDTAARIRRIIAQGTERFETRHRRKDGSTFPVEIGAQYKADEGGRLIVFLHDITERKKSEAALANMQKLESLGILAGGIAHDFNNILTAILGNLSLLQTKMQAGGEALQWLEEAQQACGTAKGLARQLLTFAKGGSPVVSVMDLRPVLTQAAGFAARGSNARCVFDLGESPLAVNIDKEQIAQVIQNLVINAIQAMPEGGDITLRSALVALGDGELPPLTAGRYVRVRVEDQGAGIPPAHRSKIFDPYFSTKAVGRGLGLAMCYSIMAKHDGNIGAASKPGAGAVFTLHFPAADPAGIPREQERPALAAGSGRVLIMDDEPPVSMVLKRMLEHLGYPAECVANGKAALDAYQNALEAGKPYDAVIMDLTIPGGMGGKEAVRRILELDPRAKVIVSSGYSDDPVVAEHEKHGFRGALIKPYKLEDVLAAMTRAIPP